MGNGKNNMKCLTVLILTVYHFGFFFFKNFGGANQHVLRKHLKIANGTRKVAKAQKTLHTVLTLAALLYWIKLYSELGSKTACEAINCHQVSHLIVAQEK